MDQDHHVWEVCACVQLMVLLTNFCGIHQRSGEYIDAVLGYKYIKMFKYNTSTGFCEMYLDTNEVHCQVRCTSV